MNIHQYPHVAFIGPIGVGKTTAASYLEGEHGYARLSFARPVKEVAANMMNVFVRFAHDRQVLGMRSEPVRWDADLIDSMKSNPGVRRLLQVVGTEIGRDMYGENLWLDLFLRDYWKTPGPIVVDDARFPNEVKLLKAQGFIIVKMNYAPSREPSVIRDNQSRHASEASLGSVYPHEVIAEDDLPSVRERIEAILATYAKGL